MKTRPHKKLEVYKSGIELVKLIYKISKELPDDEKFGLISQIKRASVSVPTNIAEGAGRESTKEFIHFLYISNGSACELDTLFDILYEQDFIDNETREELINLLDKVSALLCGLIRKLKQKNIKPYSLFNLIT